MVRMFTFIALAGLTTSLGAAKDREWKNAKVLNLYANAYFAPVPGGVPTQVGRNDSGANFEVNSTSSANSVSTEDYYVVEAPEAVYLLARVRMKMAPAAVLAPDLVVPLAIEKLKAWVMDPGGAKYEMRVVDSRPRAMISKAQ
jgi:hypothetical protein